MCSVCDTTTACVVVERETSKHHLCLLHFSIFDQKIPTFSNQKKKSASKNDKKDDKELSLKSRIIDHKEYTLQSTEVKDIWKQATADVVLMMFECEKEEQKQARLAQAPIIVPRTRYYTIKCIRSDTGVGTI